MPGRLSLQRIARLATAFACAAAACAAPAGKGSRAGLELVRPASAQTEAELSAARQLFAEALGDEQAGRHAAALEKFQRVQAVRDTQAVRYRIATCLEALGQLRAALAAYTSTSIAAAVDAESSSIARASRDKVEALSKRVARLVVTLSPHAPPDVVVKIDGEALQPNTIGTPIVLDPGLHELLATSASSLPFRARVTLGEGAQTAVEATLTPLPAPPALAPAPSPSVPEVKPVPLPEPARTPPHSRASPGRTTAGVALLGGGGLLVAGAVAVLLVRHADIQSIEAACQGGVCPLTDESNLESTRSRALVEGPVGIGLGVAGIVAAGIGVYLLLTRSAPSATALAPWIEPSAPGALWAGRF